MHGFSLLLLLLLSWHALALNHDRKARVARPKPWRPVQSNTKRKRTRPASLPGAKKVKLSKKFIHIIRLKEQVSKQELKVKQAHVVRIR